MMNTAFVSAVRDRADKRLLVIRARRKGDITRAFRGRAIEMTSHPSADYPFRTWVSKKAFARALADAVASIDYDNFKSSVKDDPLHTAYMQVWLAMLSVEGDVAKRPSAYVSDPYLPEHDVIENDDEVRDFLATRGFGLARSRREPE